MMLTLGASLVCSALLVFSALAFIFQRPSPPRWTTRSGIGELVTIALVTVLTFGLGYLGAGAIQAYQHGVSAIDLALLVAVVAGSAVIWRPLRTRLQGGTESGGAPGPVVHLSLEKDAPGAPDRAPVPPPPATRAA